MKKLLLLSTLLLSGCASTNLQSTTQPVSTDQQFQETLQNDRAVTKNSVYLAVDSLLRNAKTLNERQKIVTTLNSAAQQIDQLALYGNVDLNGIDSIIENCINKSDITDKQTVIAVIEVVIDIVRENFAKDFQQFDSQRYIVALRYIVISVSDGIGTAVFPFIPTISTTQSATRP